MRHLATLSIVFEGVRSLNRDTATCACLSCVPEIGSGDFLVTNGWIPVGWEAS